MVQVENSSVLDKDGDNSGLVRSERFGVGVP